MPSPAVTIVVIVLVPTLSAIALDATPEVTVVPLTFTVAVASVVVGVTLIDDVAFGTLAVYAVVPLANVGAKVPVDSASAESVATLDAARVTVVVYVCVVVPSPAVTIVVIVFVPTVNAIAPDATPDVTVVPLTLTVAVASVVVGVTVIDDVAFGTLAVYAVVPLANVGDRVPVESASADSVAVLDAARVTVTV